MFAKLKLVFSNLWVFLLPIFNVFAGNIGKIVLSEAVKAVYTVAQDPSILQSEEKRKIAFEAIKARLVAQGIQASTSMINSAIEMALSKLKAENVVQ